MKFLILYAPTILFILFFIGSLITGYIRGRRKALIFLVHAVIAFSITVILYVLTVRNKAADTNIVNIINLFMGSGGLQRQLGVSEANTCLTDILIEYIPKQMNYGDGLYYVFYENGSYLYAIVSQVYQLIFAILFIIVYLAFVFIFYLMYLILYPDRRYFRRLRRKLLKTTKAIEGRLFVRKKKKKDMSVRPDMVKKEDREEDKVITPKKGEVKDYALARENAIDGNVEMYSNVKEGEEVRTEEDKNINDVAPDEKYLFKKLKKVKVTKKRVWGMVIQGVRSLVTGVFVLAVLGSLLYILGGTGKRNYSENPLEGTSYEVSYDAYLALGEYGSTGIYAVLNSITDSNDFPYYLYLVDLVFRNNVEDPELGTISFNMASELGTYSNFTRSSIDLIFKYKGSEINLVVSGKSTKSMMDVMTELFKVEEFRNEFDLLIDDFEGGTYFINMGLSFVTSFVNHMDETNLEETIGSDAYEALAILFKEGYLSSYIPSEALKKAAKEVDDSIEYEPEPYISARTILTKDDTKELVNLLLDILSLDKESDDTKNILNYALTIIPEIKKLSILSSDRKDEMNPVLKRLYTYLEARYLEEAFIKLTEDTIEPVTLQNSFNVSSEDTDSVDWIKEINYLLDIALDTITLYSNVYDNTYDSVLKMFAASFDVESLLRDANIELLNNIKNKISDSKLLDKVLSSNGVYQSITNLIANSIYSDAYLVKNITYVNTYDSDGDILEYGELYKLITGLTLILSSENEKSILLNLENMGNMTPLEILDFISDIKNALSLDIDKILDSDILNSAVSAILLENEVIDEEIGLRLYIPESIMQEVDGEIVNLIDKEEIKYLFDTIDSLIDSVDDLIIEVEEGDIDYDTLISSLNLDGIKESLILRGTVANVLIKNLCTDSVKQYVTLPDQYNDTQYWIDTDFKEVTSLVNAIKNTSLSINILIQDYSTEESRSAAIKSMLSSISVSDLTRILESDILYLSISNMLSKDDITGGNVIIPSEVKEDTIFTTNGKTIEAITKTEITNLFSAIIKLGIDFNDLSSIDINSLINDFNTMDSSNKSKLDYCYDSLILVATMTNQFDSINSIIIPSSVRTEINYTVDDISYTAINKSEVKNLVTAVNDLELNLNSIDNLYVKLRVDDAEEVSSSVIIRAILSDKLESISDIIVPNKVLEDDIITSTEFANILHILATYKELFFTDILDSKVKIDTITINEDVISIDVLSVMSSTSVVFMATIINKITQVEAITIPYDYQQDSLSIKENYDNSIFITTSEMTNLFNGLELIFGAEATINTLSVTDINTLITNINEDDISDIYKSKIMASTISAKVESIESTDLKVPFDAYSNTYLVSSTEYKYLISEDEIKSVISVIKDSDLNLDLSNINIDSINLTKGSSGNIIKISNSKIFRASIYYKLINIDSLVIPDNVLDGSYNEVSTGNIFTDSYLSSEEVVLFFELIEDNKCDLGLASDNNEDTPISITNISLDDDTNNNITVSLLKNLIESSILKATIINNIYTNKDTYEIIMPINYSQSAVKSTLSNDFINNIWVTTDEVLNLLNSIGEVIGYDSKLSSINSDINTMVKSLNNTSEIDSTNTKLYIAYESIVMKSTLAKKITNLDTLVIPFDAKEDTFTYEVEDIEYQSLYITYDSVYSLINVLNDETLALDLNEVDLTSLKIETGKNIGTVSNVEVISSSSILRATIYDKLITERDEELVIPNYACSGKFESDSDNGYISYSEMVIFLSNLSNYRVELGMSLTETSPLDVSKVEVNITSLNVDKLKVMITSDIMHATAISKVSTQDGLTIPYNLLEEVDTIKENYENSTWFINSEISKLILSMESLEITTVSNANSLSGINAVNMLDDDSIDICYNSIIMVSTLTSKIKNLKKSNNEQLLVIPYSSYDGNVYITATELLDLISSTEMKSFTSSIKGLGIDLANDSYINNVTLSTNNITYITSSLILNATTSKEILGNNAIVVNNDSYDQTDEMILQTELQLFLTAVNSGLGINTISSSTINTSSIKPSSIDMDNIDDITSSMIMRATITSMVDSSVSYIYVSSSLITIEDRVSLDTNYDGLTISILAASEIKAILNVISTKDSFEVNVTLSEISSLTDSDIELYMESNIFSIKITDALVDAGYLTQEVTVSEITISTGQYNFIESTITTGKYMFIRPTSIEVIDIKNLNSGSLNASILTINDVLAYKYFINNMASMV